MNNVLLSIVSLCFSQCIFAQSVQLSKVLEKHQYTILQMEKLNTGHQVVSTEINGEKGLFVVDTGAITIIHDDLLKKYHLTKASKTHSVAAAGAGGLINVDFFPISSLVISDYDVSIIKIGATDLTAITTGLYNANGKYIDGIIGQDILMPHGAVINFKTNKLFLKGFVPIKNQSKVSNKSVNIDDLMIKHKYEAIKLNAIVFDDLDLTFFTVNIQINGVNGMFIIDSGAGRSFIHKKNLENFSISVSKNSNTETSSGAGGSFNIGSIVLPHLFIDQTQIGKQSVYSVDLSALIGFIKDQKGVVIDGLLGQDILSRYSGILNTSDNKLYLKLNF